MYAKIVIKTIKNKKRLIYVLNMQNTKYNFILSIIENVMEINNAFFYIWQYIFHV